MSQSENDHIRKYLNYYIALQGNVSFAVLLSGEWGCGKTWFIEQFVSEYKKNSPEGSRFLYISLYGLTSTREIDEQVFRQLHPVLSSKPMIWAGKFLTGVLKTSLKIDVGSDANSSATITPELKDADVPDYLRNTDDCVFIFDDLERCRIDGPVVLGYINSLVEHQNSKVIVIANEEELEKPTSGDNSIIQFADYWRIKEKLIGKTFRISYDLESALVSFLNELQTISARDCLEKRKAMIVDVFNRAGFRNLRHLHRAFLDFERLFSSFSEEHIRLPGFLDDLVPLFLSLSFEIQAGVLRTAHFNGFMASAFAANFDKKDDSHGKTSPATAFVKKYDLPSDYNLVFSELFWTEFFDKGFIPPMEVAEAVAKTVYAQSENTPTWLKLWYFFYLQDDEFSRLLEEMSKELENKSIRLPQEILHVGGLLLTFAELGLIRKNPEQVLQEAKSYIDQVASIDVWTDKQLARTPLLESGFGYHSSDRPEFKELYEYLKRTLVKAWQNKFPKSGSDLLASMLNSADTFVKTLSSYCDAPVLQHVSAEDFAQSLLKLENKDKGKIAKALKDRYELKEYSRYLLSESLFLKQAHN
jgi:hypothetical protein